MKPTIASLVLLSSLIIVTSCFGMHEGLPREIFSVRAKKFLQVIREVKNPVEEIDKDDLKAFLEQRVSNAEKSLAGDMSVAGTEFKFLDSNYVFLFTLNHLDTSPNARIAYFYPVMAEEHLVYSVRKNLGCYCTELDDFEKEYERPLEKVTNEEFERRMAPVGKNDINSLLLAGSRDFAQAILEEIFRAVRAD